MFTKMLGDFNNIGQESLIRHLEIIGLSKIPWDSAVGRIAEESQSGDKDSGDTCCEPSWRLTLQSYTSDGNPCL